MSTKIEWATDSWNVVTGCSPISEGCRNCYASRMAKRLAGRYGYPAAPNQFRPTFHRDRLTLPIVWKKPSMIFVCSMADLFHEDVPIEWFAAVFDVVAKCPQHTFMFLTKRPERMKLFFDEYAIFNYGVLPNVWLGVTAENQPMADMRIPASLKIPAAVRFVSFEPLLSNIDPIQCGAVSYGPCGGGGESGPVEYDGMANIDWAIVGAETGPGKRFMDIAWARHIRDWCNEFRISFFFKKDSTGSRLLDGIEWNELPEVIR